MRFVHTTRAQFMAEIGERYKHASGVDAAKIAAFLSDQPEADIKIVFGDLKKAEIAALKTQLADDAGKLAALRAVKGK